MRLMTSTNESRSRVRRIHRPATGCLSARRPGIVLAAPRKEASRSRIKNPDKLQGSPGFLFFGMDEIIHESQTACQVYSNLRTLTSLSQRERHRPPLQQRNGIHIDKHTCGSEFSVLNVLPKQPEQMMKRRSRRRFDQQLLPVHAFDSL